MPGGFLITTLAYQRFVDANDLKASILALARPEVVEGVVSFEKAAKRIRQLFDEQDLVSEVRAEIGAAYDALGDRPAVAVRSSATAEDSREVSFAGQHETYLNVTGAASNASCEVLRYRSER